MAQLRLCIVSNAGGAGKTTLATNLAYLMGKEGFSTVVFDLDPQGSVSLFGKLPKPEAHETVAEVLRRDFDGNYPLIPLWQEYVDNVFVCRADIELTQSIREIVLGNRGVYLLHDYVVENYPLPHDVVIFDCPATLGELPLVALAASTHIIIPMQTQAKCVKGAADLVAWIYSQIESLRLRVEPQILGIVPTQYNRNSRIQENICNKIPKIAQQIRVKAFPPIHHYIAFMSASAEGKPLDVYKKNHPGSAELDEIVKSLSMIVRG